MASTVPVVGVYVLLPAVGEYSYHRIPLTICMQSLEGVDLSEFHGFFE